MPLPETPGLSVVHSKKAPSGIQYRALEITAATLLLLLSSMHKPKSLEIVDTKIALPRISEPDEKNIDVHAWAAEKAQATAEQQAQLDSEIDACISLANPVALGRVTMFKLCHPRPELQDLKELLDSMPAEMRLRIIRITKLVALHPEECDRVNVQEILLKKISKTDPKEGASTAGVNEPIAVVSENKMAKAIRLHKIREEAQSFLLLCEEHDPAFKSELDAICEAESILSRHPHQLAQLNK